MTALCQQHYGQCPKYYPQIEKRRHVVDVKQVKDHHIIEIDRAPPGNLPQPGAPWNDGKTPAMPLLIFLELVPHARSWSDRLARLPDLASGLVTAASGWYN